MWYSSLGSLLNDIDCAEHIVMAYAAILVADNGLLADLVRGHGEDHVITGQDLEIDIGRLQGESVLPVDGGNVQAVALVLFQLENGPPLPQAPHQINVRTHRRLDHWGIECSLGAHRVLVHHLLGLGQVLFRGDPVGFTGHVLFAVDVPQGHHQGEDDPPNHHHGDPDQFALLDMFVPPELVAGRINSHYRFSAWGSTRVPGEWRSAP